MAIAPPARDRQGLPARACRREGSRLSPSAASPRFRPRGDAAPPESPDTHGGRPVRRHHRGRRDPDGPVSHRVPARPAVAGQRPARSHASTPPPLRRTPRGEAVARRQRGPRLECDPPGRDPDRGHGPPVAARTWRSCSPPSSAPSMRSSGTTGRITWREEAHECASLDAAVAAAADATLESLYPAQAAKFARLQGGRSPPDATGGTARSGRSPGPAL